MTPPASAILFPLGAIYGAVMRARLTAYQRGWFSVSKLAVPVISVGNLTTGGTGKTPLVEWVCRVVAGKHPQAGDDSGRGIARSGKRVCVLTRGYGKVNPKSQIVVSDGTNLLTDERAAGDEPYLLAKTLIGIAAVIANPNRVDAAHWALENLKSEVFVLDDGFQHLRLARDLDIVTIDATRPLGGGSLLPYGRLREPIAGLSRADCVVVTRTDQVADWDLTKNTIRQAAAAIPVFTSRMVTMGIGMLGSDRVNSETLLDQPLGAFCGVGNPESFFNQMRREGHTPRFTRTFADHHHYDQSDADSLVEQARSTGATGLITTAKDATKFTRLDLKLPCYVLEIQISIDDEDRMVQLILDAVRSPMSKVQGPKSVFPK